MAHAPDSTAVEVAQGILYLCVQKRGARLRIRTEGEGDHAFVVAWIEWQVGDKIFGNQAAGDTQQEAVCRLAQMMVQRDNSPFWDHVRSR